MATERFDENKLREDIAYVWGEHGAHIDLFDFINKRAKSLTDLRERCDKAVKELTLLLDQGKLRPKEVGYVARIQRLSSKIEGVKLVLSYMNER